VRGPVAPAPVEIGFGTELDVAWPGVRGPLLALELATRLTRRTFHQTRRANHPPASVIFRTPLHTTPGCCGRELDNETIRQAVSLRLEFSPRLPPIIAFRSRALRPAFNR